MKPEEIRIFPTALERVATAVLAAGGSRQEEARHVAQNLVRANLTGHDSHGVGMLPRYAAALQQGGLRPNQKLKPLVDTGCLLSLSAEQGYGQLLGSQAMELATVRAKQHGVCVLALSNAHHLGRIGAFAEQCAEQGLVSIHLVNVVIRPIVAAFGGLDARTGTNPICVGVPRENAPPIILDFATSKIAQGKTRVAHNRGEPVLEGTLLDDQGRPTTDPRYAVVPPLGAILPFGEHKGFGLALVAELLGGALTGSPTCRHPADDQKRILNGMLSIVLKPEALGHEAHFHQEMEGYLSWLRQSRTPEGAGAVQFPGEPEQVARAHREQAGIPIDAATWEEILCAGETLGADRTALEQLVGSGPHS